MKSNQHPRKAGWALVETMLASVLLVIFAGGALFMSRSFSDAFRVEASATEFDVRGHRAITEVVEYFRNADAASVLPDLIVAPNSSPWVEFQRITGYAEDVVLGDVEKLILSPDPGDPPDGVDNDGDGAVDEGELLLIENEGLANETRRRICRGVAASLAGEQPGNGIDDNGNGLVDEPGFCVVFDGEAITVYLSLVSGRDSGERSRSTAARTVSLRNAR